MDKILFQIKEKSVTPHALFVTQNLKITKQTERKDFVVHPI
jgi:hypothetical protein